MERAREVQHCRLRRWGREFMAQEYGRPLQAEKNKEIDTSLEPPERNSPANTLTLVL